jgi:Domain of unknown function (DUF4404)
MENKRLVDTLQQLHAELSQAQRVDAEELDLLRTLTRDIERVLSKRPGAKAPDSERASSNLRGLLLKFEAEHPELAEAIGKVADGLAAMGI